MTWTTSNQILGRRKRAAPNTIHTNLGAQSIGYRSALVEGATLFGKMASLVVAAQGRQWLEKGYFNVFFVRPYYYSQEARIKSECIENNNNQTAFKVQARAGDTDERPVAIAKIGMDHQPLTNTVDLDHYTKKKLPLPENRPPKLTANHVGFILGEIQQETSVKFLNPYYQQVQADRQIFNVEDGYVYPGLILSLCNLIFMKNFYVVPWRHIRSNCQFHNAARVGDLLKVRGKIKRIYKYINDDTAELDLVVIAGPSKIIARVSHIFNFNIHTTAA